MTVYKVASSLRALHLTVTSTLSKMKLWLALVLVMAVANAAPTNDDKNKELVELDADHDVALNSEDEKKPNEDIADNESLGELPDHTNETVDTEYTDVIYPDDEPELIPDLLAVFALYTKPVFDSIYGLPATLLRDIKNARL